MSQAVSDWYHRFRGASQRKQAARAVARINAQEETLRALPDAELRKRFLALAPRLEQTSAARALEAVRIDAFALVREAAHRALGLRPYDVQMLAGLVLAEGKLAEMRTGEGKTLAVAAPAAFAALRGKGVHVVTANPYLARRDAQTLAPLYEMLGLTVGVAEPGATPEQKRQAYGSSITYSVHYELGFDFLRDNMVRTPAARVQRGLHCAIVDEVDSILIDDARTPLVISGTSSAMTDTVLAVDAAFRELDFATDLMIDEREQTAFPSEAGYARLETRLAELGALGAASSLYAPENLHVLLAAHAAARAWGLYRKGRHYVVADGAVHIVDEGTGRLMSSRRWGAGLHEALEAKEGLAVSAQSRTEASITYQSFFGQYERLSGLTGTAFTEAEEFAEVYGLQTVVIPTHRPVVRRDAPTQVYATRERKWQAIVEEVRTRHHLGQPVLVGVASVAEAEHAERLLRAAGMHPAVLSASNHAQEADIIARAGMPGALTVATNMAGRGTDILLGGPAPVPENPADERKAWLARHEQKARRDEVLAAGGLAVIGTEHHESRRVDNQLRGRAGRQGDPGYSRFIVSMEDTVLRVFGGNAAQRMLESFADGQALEGAVVERFVARAQRMLEERGFQARREMLKFDQPVSEQRQAVYALRERLFEPEAAREMLEQGVAERIEALLDEHCPDPLDEQSWTLKPLKAALASELGLDAPLIGWVHKEELPLDDIQVRLLEMASARLAERCAESPEAPAQALFDALDELWPAHLSELDELRASSGLSAKANQNPIYVFSREAGQRFGTFAQAVRATATGLVMRPEQDASAVTPMVSARRLERERAARVQEALAARWVLRTEPCPCGSGARFKACHGRLAA